MVILPYNDRDHLCITAQSLAVQLNLPLRVQAGCGSNGHSSKNCLWSHFLRPKTPSSRGRSGLSCCYPALCHFMLNSLTIELDKKFPSPPCLCFLARRWRGMRSDNMTERKTHLSNARLHAQLNCVPFCIRVWWRSNLSMTCTHTHTRMTGQPLRHTHTAHFSCVTGRRREGLV